MSRTTLPDIISGCRGLFRRAWHSLVTRMIVFALAMLAFGLVSRMIVLSNFLKEEIHSIVAAQQWALASYVAADIDAKIKDRLRLVERLAGQLPAATLENPPALEAWLRYHHEINPLFASGLMVIRPDGRAIAEFPHVPGRGELDYTASDWFRAASDSSEAVIGRPFRGRATNEPLLTMAAAIRDRDGRPVAVLAGISALAAPGFLNLLQDVRIGETGGFLLISPRDHLFVAATNPAKALTKLPPPGRNPLHDQAMAGYRGTGITVNIEGLEELSAMVSVPTPGWFLVARLPTEEAYGIVLNTRRFLLRNAGIAAAVAIVVLLLAVPAFLRPLSDAARRIRDMAEGRLDLHPLPVVREDEVGALTQGFNALVDRLQLNEEALRASERRMAHMAHHDALTGLPNRALFDDRLTLAVARADRTRTSLALMFIDLDGFKPVNDSLGHDVGDAALCAVADRLRTAVRHADTVARLGGDEFVILVSDLETPRPAAEIVAQKCLEVMEPAIPVGMRQVYLGLSIGIALYPDDGPEATLLTSRADQAMYAAKQKGRGRYEFFAAHQDCV